MTDDRNPLQRNDSGALKPVVPQPFPEVPDDSAFDLVVGESAAAETSQARRGSVPLILLAWLGWAVVAVGYRIRPYDMLADRRCWFWQPRVRCVRHG